MNELGNNNETSFMDGLVKSGILTTRRYALTLYAFVSSAQNSSVRSALERRKQWLLFLFGFVMVALRCSVCLGFGWGATILGGL